MESVSLNLIPRKHWNESQYLCKGVEGWVVVFIYTSGQIETLLMWKLIAADWHFWVAESRRRIYDSPAAQEIPGEKRAEIPITPLSRQQKQTVSNRECSYLCSTVSEAEFDFETRRRAGRQKWWEHWRERGGERDSLSWRYWCSIDFGTSASPFVNYTALN